MKTIRIAMAEQTDKMGSVPAPVTIIIDGQLPDIDSSVDIHSFFDGQARRLAYELFYSLPQGTYDKLIIELMKRKVSVYRGLTRS